jgi:hypothetical protein
MAHLDLAYMYYLYMKIFQNNYLYEEIMKILTLFMLGPNDNMTLKHSI